MTWAIMKVLFSFNMSKRFSKVYSFEIINDELTKKPCPYNPGNIESLTGENLSSEERNAVLYIPVRDGFPLTGWASLTPTTARTHKST